MLYEREIIILLDYNLLNLDELSLSFSSRFLNKERLEIFKKAKSKERKKEILSQGILINYLINNYFHLKNQFFTLRYDKITRRAKLSFYKKNKKFYFYLNVSHSDGFLAIWTSKNKNSSIDIERVKEIDEKYYKRALSKQELELLEKEENIYKKNLAFLRFWTYKEIFVKAYNEKKLKFSKLDDSFYKKMNFKICSYFLEDKNLILSFGTEN